MSVSTLIVQSFIVTYMVTISLYTSRKVMAKAALAKHAAYLASSFCVLLLGDGSNSNLEMQ